MLSSTLLSITFKFLFEESELLTVGWFSDLIADELVEVEAATESLFTLLLLLEDSSVLSLVILFVCSTLLTYLVITLVGGAILVSLKARSAKLSRERERSKLFL